MRTGGGADDVECVMHIGDPVAQRLVHRVFQRVGAAGDGHHLGTEQLHAEHIGLLPLDILRAHIDDAGQAKARADGGGGNAMLARTGFGDDPRLAHADGEQNLADAIVDLVRAGVVQLVALEPDLRTFARGRILAAFLGQPLGIIERRRASDIMFEQIVKLRLKRRVDLRGRYSRSRSSTNGISVSAT